MQRIQISRGNIDYRQKQLALLEGEFHVDLGNTTDKGILYIGINPHGENYEYSPEKIKDSQGKLVAGPEGSYARIGSSGAVGFKGTVTDTRFLSGEDVAKIGSIYLIGDDIQLTSEEAAKFANINSDGNNPASNVELKKGDLVLYNGTKWVRVGGGATASFDVSYNGIHTNATKANTSVQDAIVSLDSKKLQYGGLLKTSLNANYTKNPDENNSTPKLLDGDGQQVDIFGDSSFNDWGDLEGSLWSISIPCTIDGESYEEGDFLAITSNTSWEARTQILDNPAQRRLLGNQVVFTKIVGGTRDAAKINVHADQFNRNNTSNNIYKDKDSQIKNVQGALESLFGTKADLGTDGKVLVSQLPNTVIGGMDYQGTWSNQRVPEDKDKTPSPNGTIEILQKGDYWVYNGEEAWDITDAPEFDKLTPEEAEGNTFKRLIKKGDWIIHNGKNSWSVIDNTDAFIGLTDETNANTLDGVVTLKGNKRDIPQQDPVVEVEATVQSDGSNSIKFTTPNAVLEPAKPIIENIIPKAGPNRTIVESGLMDDGNTLTIVESNGLVISRGGENSATVNLKINNDQTAPVGDSNIININFPKNGGTLLTDKDSGVADGTKYTLAMFDLLEGEEKTKLVNSFLSFIEGQITIKGENSPSPNPEIAASTIKGLKLQQGQHGANILLSDDPEVNTQILPRTSGYLLNTNSIIDCGIWEQDKVINPREGHVSKPTDIKSDVTNFVDYNNFDQSNTSTDAVNTTIVDEN